VISYQKMEFTCPLLLCVLDEDVMISLLLLRLSVLAAERVTTSTPLCVVLILIIIFISFSHYLVRPLFYQ